ncbi:unnamed protein product [Linum trigynum]|uniref:Endonuclease/exonuclease/phosphatase domain-containing protein n=1 Tax=Linum trigynum TaxID=586398 RepID=A0AAV2FV59_9ROSI
MANGVCDKIGFPNSIRVEAEGRSGGIWVFWDVGAFSVQLYSACSQHLSLQVSRGSDPSWLLTAVYASPRQGEQRQLWERLISHSKNITMPWLLTGDFNAISKPDEKSGIPASNTLRRCQLFTERMNLAELVDLGFSGVRFTWSRGENMQSYKASRLDRSLYNIRWNSVFPYSSVLHLPRYHSDHCPILTSVAAQPSGQQPMKAFRFEAAWLTDERLRSVVAESWSSSAL